MHPVFVAGIAESKKTRVLLFGMRHPFFDPGVRGCAVCHMAASGRKQPIAKIAAPHLVFISLDGVIAPA